MKVMSRVDAVIGKYLPFFILGCTLLGAALPDVFSVLVPALIPLIAFQTLANCLGANFRQLAGVFRAPLPVVVTLFVLHIALPLIALGLGNLLLPFAPLFIVGMVLQLSTPTAITSLMWTTIGGGNVQLCLSMVLLDTLAAPIVIPAALRVFLGSSVTLDSAGMIQDLILMVALPALAAMFFYRFNEGRSAKALKARLLPFAKIAMLFTVLANATRCAPFLRNLNQTLLIVAGIVLLLGFTGFTVGFLMGGLMHRDFPTRFTMSLNSGMRNNGIATTLATQYFPADVVFPAAIAPLFAQVTASVVVRLLPRTKAGKAYYAQQAQKDGE